MLATLNLLSPEKKAALRAGYVLAFVQTLVLLVFTVSLFAFATILAVRMMLVGTRDDLASRSALEETELGSVTTEARQINEYLARIEDYQDRYSPTSTFLIALSPLVPEGITLTEVRVEAETVSMSGVAATRDDVLAMQTNLRASPLFTDVQSPLSNILQQVDVEFDFTMTLVGVEPSVEE